MDVTLRAEGRQSAAVLGGLQLRVAAVEDDAGARTFTLTRPDGGLLPPFVPGSHVVVDCGESTNAYSLLDDGIASDSYRISVLLCPDGDGGSRWMHEALRVGDGLAISLPRSSFPPVAVARQSLLIAAGIGVTPILSHARAARRWGRSLTVLYRYRPDRGAHLSELREVCGSDLEEFTNRASFDTRLADSLGSQPLGSHLFVCGPGGFTDPVLAAAADQGWPSKRLHTERFSAADLAPGRAFSVRLQDGRLIEVPSGVSLLETLERQGIRMSHRCREGICGECRIRVLSGTPEHRDLFLTEPERAANDSVMCCVSRAYGELEIAL